MSGHAPRYADEQQEEEESEPGFDPQAGSYDSFQDGSSDPGALSSGASGSSAPQMPQSNGSSRSGAPTSRTNGPSPSISGREITRELVLKCLEKQGSIRPIPSQNVAAEEKALKKATHLHLDNQHLGVISRLHLVPNLSVLYMYDNRIRRIENLQVLPNLTHLYLQNNCLEDTCGLTGLRSLEKLYLERNSIEVVSGLDDCTNLEELHISWQHTAAQGGGGRISSSSGSGHVSVAAPGPPINVRFDPASLAALSRCLRVLMAKSCGITSCAALADLRALRRLDLSDNALSSQQDLEIMLQPMSCLLLLDLRGNPVTKQLKYRDSVTLMSDSMVTLDGEDIVPTQRECLMRLHIHKLKAAVRADEVAAARAGGGAGYSSAPPSQPSSRGGGGPGSRGPGPASQQQQRAPYETGHHHLPPKTGGFARVGTGGAPAMHGLDGLDGLRLNSKTGSRGSDSR